MSMLSMYYITNKTSIETISSSAKCEKEEKGEEEKKELWKL